MHAGRGGRAAPASLLEGMVRELDASPAGGAVPPEGPRQRAGGPVPRLRRGPSRPSGGDRRPRVRLPGGPGAGDPEARIAKAREQAIDRVIERHLANPEIVRFFSGLQYGVPSPKGETLLRAALARSPHREVRAAACYELARFLRFEAGVPGELKAMEEKPLPDDPAVRMVREWQVRNLKPFLGVDPAAARAEAERLLERVGAGTSPTSRSPVPGRRPGPYPALTLCFPGGKAQDLWRPGRGGPLRAAEPGGRQAGPRDRGRGRRRPAFKLERSPRQGRRPDLLGQLVRPVPGDVSPRAGSPRPPQGPAVRDPVRQHRPGPRDPAEIDPRGGDHLALLVRRRPGRPDHLAVERSLVPDGLRDRRRGASSARSASAARSWTGPWSGCWARRGEGPSRECEAGLMGTRPWRDRLLGLGMCRPVARSRARGGTPRECPGGVPGDTTAGHALPPGRRRLRLLHGHARAAPASGIWRRIRPPAILPSRGPRRHFRMSRNVRYRPCSDTKEKGGVDP